MFYSGTQQFVTKLGDAERYSDEAMTWCEDVEDAHIYEDQLAAELDAAWWRNIFVGCSIDVVPLP